MQPCEMILLPWAGVPRRWNRKALWKWSTWFGRYVEPWKGHSEWEPVRTVGMQVQSMDRWGITTTAHTKGLPVPEESSRWGKMAGWCMADSGARWLGQGGVLTLCTICRNPQLEYMTTGGLCPLAEAIIQGDHTGTIHARARSLAKMLPMLDSNERARLKRLPSAVVTVNGLQLVEMIKEAGQRAKMEDVLEAARNARGMLGEYMAFEVLAEYGPICGYIRLVRYLTKQRETGTYGTAQMWFDYVRELEALGEAEGSRLYPKNLQEAHRETGLRIKAQNEQGYIEAVRNRAEALKKRFTFEACGIRMEPFGSPEEIIREGAKLDICIGSYVRNYANGGTILLKLRKKSDPDTPWHAVEFEKTGRALVQCRGYRNKTWPEDVPLVEAFWEAWNKTKKQKQKPHLIINHQARRKAQ